MCNVEARKRTGQAKLGQIIKEGRLRWLGHVIRMDNYQKQALNWNLSSTNREDLRKNRTGHYVQGFERHQIDLA